MTERIGIYSGTFDPVHQGHIAFSLGAAGMCGLDKVVLLPERNPRGKKEVKDFSKRVIEIGKAIAPFPALHMETLDVDRFTVQETLPELQRLFPDAEITLLIGSDVVRTLLYRWENLEVLLARVSLAIGMRNTETRDEVTTILRQVEKQHGLTVQHAIIETEYDDFASSRLRKTMA